jgi:hypothetical protein
VIAAGFVLAAAISVALLLSVLRPQPAQAASCSINDIASFSSGALTVEGSGLCSDHAESIKAYCSGTVLIDYAFIDTNDLSATKDTGVPCASVSVVDIEGLNGNDRIEMTALGSARLANGGAGDDTLLVRNGVNDYAECGDGFDSVQADQSNLDAVHNCELLDVLPDAAAPQAKKKCKKKHRRQAAVAKKCKRKGH